MPATPCHPTDVSLKQRMHNIEYPNDNDIQIKTWTIQNILAPLITKVTCLVDKKSNSDDIFNGKSRFRSKISSQKLIDELIIAIDNFDEVGKEIMLEHENFRCKIKPILDEIQDKGAKFVSISKQFLINCRDVNVRQKVAESARQLLFMVTRLLIVADMIDSAKVKEAGQSAVNLLCPSTSKKEKNINEWFNKLQSHINEIDQYANTREKDLINGLEREKVAVLRKSVQKHAELMEKTTLVNPKETQINSKKARDIIALRLSQYINDLIDLCSHKQQISTEKCLFQVKCVVDIPNCLDEFMTTVNEEIVKNKESITKLAPKLELMLENCIRDIGLTVDSSDRREEDRTCIANMCNSIRQTLQNIIKIDRSNEPGKQEKHDLLLELDYKCQNLKKKLRKIITFQYNDLIYPPLKVIQSLENSFNDKNLCKKAIKIFHDNNTLLTEKTLEAIASFKIEVEQKVSNILSTFVKEAVLKRCVLIAVHRFTIYSDEIVEIVKSQSEPKHLQKTDFWITLRQCWIESNQLLIDSVDESCRIEDHLSCCDHLILDAITTCLNSTQWTNQQRYGQYIISKVTRLLSVVNSEMNRYESGQYTEIVRKAMQLIIEEALPTLCRTLNSRAFTIEDVKDKKEELVYVSNLVYDAVRELRCAVLMNSALELPSDSEDGASNDDILSNSRKSTPIVDKFNENSLHCDGKSIDRECIPREVMRKLPQEEMDQIERQVKVLKKEKRTFDREVLKWDEKGNDIVMLARKMCVIMMEMSDFTRGHGPLRTTMDVISAAKIISDYGVNLDKIARNIALECVESQSKQDLLAYLDRISLFTHQLNITSRVKADVQNISGELILSGLDSAISLITSAKNLMNAVISVVKTTTTKSPSQNNVVHWHMKPPEKKPLFIIDQDMYAKVRTE